MSHIPRTKRAQRNTTPAATCSQGRRHLQQQISSPPKARVSTHTVFRVFRSLLISFESVAIIQMGPLLTVWLVKDTQSVPGLPYYLERQSYMFNFTVLAVIQHSRSSSRRCATPKPRAMNQIIVSCIRLLPSTPWPRAHRFISRFIHPQSGSRNLSYLHCVRTAG